ncbi:hypothetical protein RQP53_13645 [Paucibacter sp. APW11]|uniref:Uncharacterized protein n=1 Tax=Roseateles aquae TaxID=3077235 RepID=A0ABU3PDA1_9BURK|nr:hypothetical protein [Paucibacter sp. APW11]MDT9000312.1 hypothetical protein [Paucibacter sp. APW11]
MVAQRWKRQALVSAAILALLGSCMGPSAWRDWKAKQQRERAYAKWQERCKKSGEFIHKTVENVEGVYLVNVRTRKENENQGEQPEDQFRLSDPYGHDLPGDGYVETFLRNSYHFGRTTPWPANFPPYKGYRFVEASDPEDGKLYRYTGRVEEPWQTDKSYLKGYTRFVLDKTPIPQRTARYGVKFEDISTHEEREHWIAGSSLKVIDLQTQEVIAERIGYMVDWAQGSRAGGRQPWTFAADNACPAFDSDYPTRPVKNQSGVQRYQTLRFVEKTLKPLN